MWRIEGVAFQRGGPVVVRRESAPFGLRLPYRRAAGQAPAVTPLLQGVVDRGWKVGFLPNYALSSSQATPVKLGDLLLEMAVVNALSMAVSIAGAPPSELVYRGPRPDLMARCELPLTVEFADTGHLVFTPSARPVEIAMRPNRPAIWNGEETRVPNGAGSCVSAWLDPIADMVEVHSALPMRYHLQIEQDLGVLIPRNAPAAPQYRSDIRAAQPGHVVFVATTSAAGGPQDYGIGGFLEIARILADDGPGNWSFTVLAERDVSEPRSSSWPPASIVSGLGAHECVDLFASAQLVIGNDTGLTHLAALTSRPDGTGPDVIGFHGRYNHLKWVTGSTKHHAVATPFSQMMALADIAGLYVNQYGRYIDDSLWATSGVDLIQAAAVAEFARGLTASSPVGARQGSEQPV